MRSDRLARTLLRLYPRAWRERYGDEFLAFVADSGLSWRAVADIAGAAIAERIRAVVALAWHQHEVNPAAPLQPGVSRSIREVLAEGGLYMSLVCLTTWALVLTGVPLPSRSWWLYTFFLWSSHNPAREARWSERAAASFFRFAAALALTGVGWLTGSALSRLGMPRPSDGAFIAILVVVCVAAVVRLLYCGHRILVYGSTWPGMHPREVPAWNAALFLVCVVAALDDSGGELIWPFTMIFSGSLVPPPFELTRAGAVWRRAQHEEMERRAFGGGSGGPQ